MIFECLKVEFEGQMLIEFLSSLKSLLLNFQLDKLDKTLQAFLYSLKTELEFLAGSETLKKKKKLISLLSSSLVGQKYSI